MPEPTPVLEFRDVEKAYGALRPFRARNLTIGAGTRTALIGLDQTAAEVFVNLATGSTLPDRGEVRAFGRATSAIADADEWLRFVERFAFVTDRVPLLEGMTVAQNLALPFSIEIDPIPLDVLARVRTLAESAALDAAALEAVAGGASALVKAKVRLARAIALAPSVLLLEHPSASLESRDIKEYASLLGRLQGSLGFTMVVATLDEKFAGMLSGDALVWKPATGEFGKRGWW